MKHLKNLAKAFLAAGIVLEGGGRLADKLPAKLMVKTYDLRPMLAGGGTLFVVLTVAGLAGKKVAAAVVPTA